MSKAVICPVCNGNGLVSAGFYSHPGDYPCWATVSTNPEKCRSCDGKGWVEVNEDWRYSNPIYPTIPYPDYNPEHYRGSGYQFVDRCLDCGGDRNLPPGAGCRVGSHYGAYCEV